MIFKFQRKISRGQVNVFFFTASVLLCLYLYIDKSIFHEKEVSFSQRKMNSSKEGFIGKDNKHSNDSQLYQINMDSRVKAVCEIPPLTKLEDFFNYDKKVKDSCKNMSKIGGRGDGDGAKFVCFDEPYKMVSNNCVVLSFGINYEFSFDIGMSQMGCAVHSFDHTMTKFKIDTPEGVNFYELGISNYKGKMKIAKNIFGKVDRYENILSILNLLDKKIDYLKMDIEGSEFEFLDDVLSNSIHLLENVKQIGMEIHPSKPDKNVTLNKSLFNKLWIYMHELECVGFDLVRFDPNLAPVNIYQFKKMDVSECYETVWVKK
ncbi:UNVERIFIED_CONTAM: hypothetical protein RMT77_008314 [Armadillidium vulgare]